MSAVVCCGFVPLALRVRPSRCLSTFLPPPTGYFCPCVFIYSSLQCFATPYGSAVLSALLAPLSLPRTADLRSYTRHRTVTKAPSSHPSSSSGKVRSPTFARAAGFAAWACVCRRSQLCGRCCSASLRGGGKDGSPVAAATGVGLHPEAATSCANSPFHLGEHFFFFFTILA